MTPFYCQAPLCETSIQSIARKLTRKTSRGFVNNLKKSSNSNSFGPYKIDFKTPALLSTCLEVISISNAPTLLAINVSAPALPIFSTPSIDIPTLVPTNDLFR